MEMFGAGRHEGGEDLGRRHVGVLGEKMVLGRPRVLEAVLLGAHGDLDALHEALVFEVGVLGEHGLRHGTLGEESELHGISSCWRNGLTSGFRARDRGRAVRWRCRGRSGGSWRRRGGPSASRPPPGIGPGAVGVGVVGLVQQAVDADLGEGVGGEAVIVVEEAPVDLAVVVDRRRFGDELGDATPGPVALPDLVAAFEDVGDPANLAFGVGDLQVRVPDQHARHQVVDHRRHGVSEGQG